MIRELFFSRRAVPTWLALAALFVALGGPSWAGDLVSGKKISGSKIKKGTITGKQVKNGSLTEVELEPATAAALRAVGPDSVTAAAVADGSLGGTELADGSVAGSDLADGTVGNADLGADAVDTAKIPDGNLQGADVGRFSGSVEINFGSVAANSCKTGVATVPAVSGSQDLNDDAIIVTPRAGFPFAVATVTAQPNGPDQLAVTLCNHTAGALNINNRTYNYVSIDAVGQ